uniref:RNase H type-1 domain-containing protein n=1 Tax=Setaria viridis TaxID=4556 RepID=A0A4U6SZY6_SETVI|nr:hypothetical protein SEVIR_9G314800v2 [Setaria viridis]
MENRKRRNLEVDSSWRLCGLEEEDAFHAVISCTKVRALRQALRKSWEIAPEQKFMKSGPEWLLLLLTDLSLEERAQTLFLLWRAWRIRNDAVHGKGDCSISGSVRFLETDIKGKGPKLDVWKRKSNGSDRHSVASKKSSWSPPPVDWVKLIVDGSFCEQTGEASLGVVIGDHDAHVLLSSWRILPEWIEKPTIIESDCSNVVAHLKLSSEDRSRWHFLHEEVKGALRLLLEGRNKHSLNQF